MYGMRREQTEAFKGAALRAFEDEMVKHLVECDPQYAFLGEGNVRQNVQHGVSRARGHGFTNRGTVRFYIEMMFAFGESFETEPHMSWAKDILNEHTDEQERANLLYHTALFHCGRDLGRPSAYEHARQPIDSPVLACPEEGSSERFESAADRTGFSETPYGFPRGYLPATCADAPVEIRLPKEINDAMDDAWKNSFPRGKSQEHGGIIILDRNGAIRAVASPPGTSDSFVPDLRVGAGETIIGDYHTHPYSKREGGYTGVSFTGSDVNCANFYSWPAYLHAGTKQFMIMPTLETPISIHGMRRRLRKEYKSLRKSGRRMPDASTEAVNKIAREYKMAYYEGSNGILRRVD